MKIKVVLFDLVGTLIDVKGSVGLVYSNVADIYGYKTDPKILDDTFAKLFKSTEKPTGGNEDEKNWWREIVFRTYEESGYDLGEDFEKIFQESFARFANKSSWDVFNDVNDTLLKLEGENLKLGILSNFDSRLENILEEIDLKKHFDLLVYSGKAGYSKPDPRIFQYAMNELDVLPEEILYIGDSLDMDYYPATNLNINTLLIDRFGNYSNTLNLTKINSLSGLFDHLN